MLQPSKRFPRRAPLSTRTMVRPLAREFYGSTLKALVGAGAPLVVGGAFALKHYAGVARDTKDLDLFVRERDISLALGALEGRGFETELTFPHWLAKAFYGDHFVDLIFNSANGLCPVDDAWFENAVRVTIFGTPALLCPIEEVIWTKCFVMERERFDGADVCHLIEAKGETIDWRRLLARFGPNWRVLLGHLSFYGFVYPRRRDNVPAWVTDELIGRLEAERDREDIPVCRGTLVSREQYLVDVRERGYEDARIRPWGHVPRAQIDLWTDAIGKIK
jgi:hypothetical protein